MQEAGRRLCRICRPRKIKKSGLAQKSIQSECRVLFVLMIKGLVRPSAVSVMRRFGIGALTAALLDKAYLVKSVRFRPMIHKANSLHTGREWSG